MITADTITDEQIRRLLSALCQYNPSGGKDAPDVEACQYATAKHRDPEGVRRCALARARCAEIINARVNHFCGRLDCPGGSLHAHDIDDTAIVVTDEPFCACGHRVSLCDRSRAGCLERAILDSA